MQINLQYTNLLNYSFQENCSPPTSQALQLLEIDDSLAACISNHLDMETSYDLLESFLNY